MILITNRKNTPNNSPTNSLHVSAAARPRDNGTMLRMRCHYYNTKTKKSQRQSVQVSELSRRAHKINFGAVFMYFFLFVPTLQVLSQFGV
jgi:hypothetical protein